MKVILAAGAILFAVVIPVTNALAQEWGSPDDEECMMCHDDRTEFKLVDGKKISLFVDYAKYATSTHAREGCTSCHADVDVDDLPHEDELEPVECDMCHDKAVTQFNKSLHGNALEKGHYLAPTCESCHGKHDILPSSDVTSKTYVMNIPDLCGGCHKEGTRVSELQTISQHGVLENYSQSIHGDGLFRRGLTVTAVCTSCHASHGILPHENPESTINAANIAATCMQCHAEIERVHVKVVKGELWEKEAHNLPICVDCHQPHQVRRVLYADSFPDEMCLNCHTRPDIHKTVDSLEVSLTVDPNELFNSDHATIQCIKCHANARTTKSPVCIGSGKVDCSMCHAEQVADFSSSEHGKIYASGDTLAPYCTDCHGDHGILPLDDRNSPTFSRNIPDLCGQCHRDGAQAAVAYNGGQHDIVNNYTMSIHGKGLLESGLLVTATCISCHTAHKELPASDTLSTVHRDNIAGTCSNCHLGIYEEFQASVHSSAVTKTDKELPACQDCHQSHTIQRIEGGSFRQDILGQCGRCHEDVAETYFATFHGKVSHLGSDKTARCYDCHGSHGILPPTDPKSTLSRANVVETCKTCHPNSNRQFVGYLTHATHHDKDKYPFLYYTYWAMTSLLVGVFTLFGLHILLWLPRAIHERRKQNRVNRNSE
ncbi:cytochrome c3 family protein [Bacteroidota bacterium]